MKKIPMILTFTRCIVPFLFFFLEPFSIPFFIAFFYCCASDVLDGVLARLLHTVTPLGSRLDSFADFIFVVITTAVLLPTLQLPLFLTAWICGIFLVKFAIFLTCFFKYQKLVIGVHTLANKVAGLAFAIYPLLAFLSDPVAPAGFLCFLASVAVLEELALVMSSKELNTDMGGLWIKRK